MSELWIHPAVILLAGATLVPLVRGRARSALILLVPLLAFARIASLGQGTFGTLQFLDWELTFGRVDRLSQVFGYIMGLMCVLGSLYGMHVKRAADHSAAWCYAAGSLGVIYAGDYLVLFLFWELMAFSAVFLIWLRGSSKALGAGYRYLLVHVLGGLSLLGGIILRYQATGGDYSFGLVDVANPDLSTYLILIGFILNAAAPPFHGWLPDAYSAATVTGSVFLCAFTTKTAVYALCRGFAGMDILLPLGVIMAVYGVVYAVLENDARKLLAYDIISQVGFMVAAVGIGTGMAINGACAHAFAHILYKGLLFMGTGSVLMMTGKSKLTELGGLYRKMPWVLVFTLIGGLSVSAFPLFSGFITKSMILAAGFEEHRNTWAFLLILASAGPFLYIGLKLTYFIWFGKNTCSRETWDLAKDPPWNMIAAMAIMSFFCIFIGCYTPYLYQMLPNQPVDFHPYTAYQVSETLQIRLFTAVGFFLLLRQLVPTSTISMDVDWLYRMTGRGVRWVATRPLQAIDERVCDAYRFCGMAWLILSAKASAAFDWNVIDGVVDGLARTVRSTGERLRHIQSAQLQVNIFSAVGVLVVLLLGVVYSLR